MTTMEMLIAVAIVAVLVGGGLGFLLGSRRGRRADARVAKAEAELEAYRGSVTDHFRQTAVRFRELGEQYLSLHEHLAQGADKLCDVSRDEAKLRFEPLAALEASPTDATDEPAPKEETSPAAPEPITADRNAPPVDYELPAMSAEAPSSPAIDEPSTPEPGDESARPDKDDSTAAGDSASREAAAAGESPEATREGAAGPEKPERPPREADRPQTIH